MSSSQAPVTTGLLLGGGTLVLLSQGLSQALPLEGRLSPLWLTALGLAFFTLGALNVQSERLQGWLERVLAKPGGWLSIANWQVVLLVISPFFAILTPLAAGNSLKMTSPVVALTSWGLAIGMVIVGGKASASNGARLRWSTLLWAAALTTIAFLLRGYATGRAPIFLTGDEGSVGLDAVRFARGEADNIFITGWFSFPTLYYFIQSLSIRAFGQTTEALRIPSALAGALTVTSVYFIGRVLFDRRTGLLAALFLAGFHFHVHFSRIGLNNIWDGLWYAITVGALWYGWAKEKRSAYLLAGFSLGIAQYFYPSGRTLLPLIVVWLIIVGLFNRTRFKGALPHLVLFVLVTTIVVLPLVWFYISHPNEYLAPLQRVTVLGSWLENQIEATGRPAWKIILSQIGTGFQAFTYTPLRAWYTPGVPLLRPFAAGLFLLGLALLALRGRDSRLALLALWLIAFGLVGGLSESTPAAQRYAAVAPACALIVGYGLGESLALLEKVWPKAKWLFGSLAIAAILTLAADELYFYFFEYTPRSIVEQARSNGMVAHRLSEYLQDKPEDVQVVFFGQPYMGYYSIPSLQYLAPQIKGIDMIQPWGSADNPQPTAAHLLFVFLPSHESEISAVQAAYPGGSLHTELAVDKNVLYWLYEYSP